MISASANVLSFIVTVPSTMNFDEGDGTVMVCATLTSAISGDLVIRLSTADGTG